MKRWIAKPSREFAGKYVVVDTCLHRGFVVADDISRALALEMVRQLEKVFA